jgi:hypothetical protein
MFVCPKCGRQHIKTEYEYYLAYKLATDPNQNTHIILLDRSLSTERGRSFSKDEKRKD